MLVKREGAHVKVLTKRSEERVIVWKGLCPFECEALHFPFCEVVGLTTATSSLCHCLERNLGQRGFSLADQVQSLVRPLLGSSANRERLQSGKSLVARRVGNPTVCGAFDFLSR